MDASLIDYYRKIHNSHFASSQKESLLYEINNSIIENFEASPDYMPDVKINGEYRELIVSSTTDDYQKNIIAKPSEEFGVGDYVECYGSVWIVISVDPNKQYYTIGKMRQCSLLLKWQNKRGKIIERWGVVAEELFGNLYRTEFMATPDASIKIFIPLDSETKNLRYDKRFLIDDSFLEDDPDAYILTGRNLLSNNHEEGCLIKLTLSKDSFNPVVDNKSLMIADYFIPTEQVNTDANTVVPEIVFTGKPMIYMGGSYKTFSAVFYNEKGQVKASVTPLWSWEVVSELKDKFESSIVDNKLKIKALYYKELIGCEVKIILEDTEGLCYTELIMEVGDL